MEWSSTHNSMPPCPCGIPIKTGQRERGGKTSSLSQCITNAGYTKPLTTSGKRALTEDFALCLQRKYVREKNKEEISIFKQIQKLRCFGWHPIRKLFFFKRILQLVRVEALHKENFSSIFCFSSLLINHSCIIR